MTINHTKGVQVIVTDTLNTEKQVMDAVARQMASHCPENANLIHTSFYQMPGVVSKRILAQLDGDAFALGPTGNFPLDSLVTDTLRELAVILGVYKSMDQARIFNYKELASMFQRGLYRQIDFKVVFRNLFTTMRQGDETILVRRIPVLYLDNVKSPMTTEQMPDFVKMTIYDALRLLPGGSHSWFGWVYWYMPNGRVGRAHFAPEYNHRHGTIRCRWPMFLN